MAVGAPYHRLRSPHKARDRKSRGLSRRACPRGNRENCRHLGGDVDGASRDGTSYNGTSCDGTSFVDTICEGFSRDGTNCGCTSCNGTSCNGTNCDVTRNMASCTAASPTSGGLSYSAPSRRLRHNERYVLLNKDIFNEIVNAALSGLREPSVGVNEQTPAGRAGQGSPVGRKTKATNAMTPQHIDRAVLNQQNGSSSGDNYTLSRDHVSGVARETLPVEGVSSPGRCESGVAATASALGEPRQGSDEEGGSLIKPCSSESTAPGLCKQGSPPPHPEVRNTPGVGGGAPDDPEEDARVPGQRCTQGPRLDKHPRHAVHAPTAAAEEEEDEEVLNVVDPGCDCNISGQKTRAGDSISHSDRSAGEESECDDNPPRCSRENDEEIADVCLGIGPLSAHSGPHPPVAVASAVRARHVDSIVVAVETPPNASTRAGRVDRTPTTPQHTAPGDRLRGAGAGAGGGDSLSERRAAAAHNTARRPPPPGHTSAVAAIVAGAGADTATTAPPPPGASARHRIIHTSASAGRAAPIPCRHQHDTDPGNQDGGGVRETSDSPDMQEVAASPGPPRTTPTPAPTPPQQVWVHFTKDTLHGIVEELFAARMALDTGDRRDGMEVIAGGRDNPDTMGSTDSEGDSPTPSGGGTDSGQTAERPVSVLSTRHSTPEADRRHDNATYDGKRTDPECCQDIQEVCPEVRSRGALAGQENTGDDSDVVAAPEDDDSIGEGSSECTGVADGGETVADPSPPPLPHSPVPATRGSAAGVGGGGHVVRSVAPEDDGKRYWVAVNKSLVTSIVTMAMEEGDRLPTVSSEPIVPAPVAHSVPVPVPAVGMVPSPSNPAPTGVVSVPALKGVVPAHPDASKVKTLLTHNKKSQEARSGEAVKNSRGDAKDKAKNSKVFGGGDQDSSAKKSVGKRDAYVIKVPCVPRIAVPKATGAGARGAGPRGRVGGAGRTKTQESRSAKVTMSSAPSCGSVAINAISTSNSNSSSNSTTTGTNSANSSTGSSVVLRRLLSPMTSVHAIDKSRVGRKLPGVAPPSQTTLGALLSQPALGAASENESPIDLCTTRRGDNHNAKDKGRSSEAAAPPVPALPTPPRRRGPAPGRSVPPVGSRGHAGRTVPQDSPRHGWVALSKADVHTIVDSLTNAMLVDDAPSGESPVVECMQATGCDDTATSAVCRRSSSPDDVANKSPVRCLSPENNPANQPSCECNKSPTQINQPSPGDSDSGDSITLDVLTVPEAPKMATSSLTDLIPECLSPRSDSKAFKWKSSILQRVENEDRDCDVSCDVTGGCTPHAKPTTAPPHGKRQKRDTTDADTSTRKKSRKVERF